MWGGGDDDDEDSEGRGRSPDRAGDRARRRSDPVGTGPENGDGNAAPRSPARLVGVDVGRHEHYDRIVLRFRGAILDYDVRYVERLHEPGSGREVRLGGAHALRALVTPVHPGSAPRAVMPRLPALRSVRLLGPFEARLTVGVAVGAGAGTSPRRGSASPPSPRRHVS